VPHRYGGADVPACVLAEAKAFGSDVAAEAVGDLFVLAGQI